MYKKEAAVLKKFSLPIFILSLIFLELLIGCKKEEPQPTKEPQIELLKSNQEGIDFRVNVSELSMYTVKKENETFYRISPPSGKQQMMLGGNENISFPEVPIYSTFLALPVEGEAEKIDIEPEGKPITRTVKLYPVQPEQRNKIGEKDSAIFVFDRKKYLQKQTYVKEVVSFRPVQQVDANIYKLSFNLVDYNPNTETLVMYPSIKIKIRFKGKIDCFRIIPRVTKVFKRDQIDSLFEDYKYLFAEKLLNYNIFSRYFCLSEFEPIYLGSQFLIITPKNFLNASQKLREHKISRGISTTVVTTQLISNKFGDGSGTVTDSQIKDYIKDYYKRSLIRFKWLLLMGDAEYIPPHYTTQKNFWDTALNAGDQYYGQLDDNDLSIPIFGIGRFPVDTEQQAFDVVNKIIDYENNPPSIFNRYYYDLTFAAQFQDDNLDNRADRQFAETAENIRDYLLTLGYSIERIYSSPSASSPTYWLDGTTIPAALQRPTFAWSGNTTNIINATNDGTSILFHRNHGWWTGWGTPSFSTTDLGSIHISNSEYPVVFSINCASGMFDNETVDLPANIVDGGYGPSTSGVYWAETFIRKGDGAIGVIGDTRSSDTYLNNTMARGLFDAVFPGYDPFGSSSSIRTLGDVLNHAKSYVSSSGYSDESVKQENTIYNLLGDPTISVKTSRYWIVAVDYIRILKKYLEIKIKYTLPECLKCPPLDVNLREKTIVVAQEPKSGRIIGRGVLNQDGSVNIQIGDYRGSLMLTFSSADVKTLKYKYLVK